MRKNVFWYLFLKLPNRGKNCHPQNMWILNKICRNLTRVHAGMSPWPKSVSPKQKKSTEMDYMQLLIWQFCTEQENIPSFMIFYRYIYEYPIPFSPPKSSVGALILQPTGITCRLKQKSSSSKIKFNIMYI